MNKDRKKEEALNYHSKPIPGKIEVNPTKKYATQKHLSLAYSPGVAEPCLAIAENKEDVYKYTSKGNLVAVISNGTAVLGLGDIGPEASKPVMEGKGVLFKIFAGIDVFDIEIDTKNTEEFIQTVKNIAPTFGGINLEDIKAPEAFEIERRLKEELDIPVMHDDQHGTAIISAAALMNAVELAGKEISKVKIVVNGAGAAAISCARIYLSIGAKRENIIMCDSKGVIKKDREYLTPEKAEFATDAQVTNLEQAMRNADVFVGLSVADVVTPEMLNTMNSDPIVFAMANPNPEIEYDVALAARKDVIMATGRSDHPNQVNNVLGFPFIFRGALDVRATKINEEMKIAAVYALSALAKQTVPEQVNITYGETNLQFGREYIIPKPFDTRLIIEVPLAVAKAAVASGVAKKPIEDWDAYKEELAGRLGTGTKMMRTLIARAKSDPKRVIFAEADNLNVLKAAQIVHEDGIAKPILLGNKAIIEGMMKEINFEANIPIIDPKAAEEKERREKYGEIFWGKNQRNGTNLMVSKKLMRERTYFGTMMLLENEADAIVAGHTKSFHAAAKPMIDMVGLENDVNNPVSMSILVTELGPLFFSDIFFNNDPTEDELVEIARVSHRVMKLFGVEPVLAMLSHSNFGSTGSESAKKVSNAVKKLHEQYPEIIVDGEIQADFALNRKIRMETFPFTKLKDKKVNGLIFPNLDAANIGHKLLKSLNKTESIGPISLGIRKPVQVFQLGCSVDEMVNMVCIAVIDAQEHEKKQVKN
jgi:malate dehydrogenase (oxaloacetate-decarboxylating)(NADP+)